MDLNEFLNAGEKSVVLNRRKAVIGGVFFVLLWFGMGFASGYFWEKQEVAKNYDVIKSLVWNTITLCEEEGRVAAFFAETNEFGHTEIFPRCILEKEESGIESKGGVVVEVMSDFKQRID